MKNIAIIGLGTVASGVYEILSHEPINDFKVKRIVVKDPSKDRLVKGFEPLLSSFEEVLSDKDIDIIIELINDEKVAFDMAKATLEKGKTFISGSKKMLANNLKYLEEIADKNGSQLLYEAAVCGSIPIIMLLQQYFRSNTPQKIRTIANGTSNYILSQLWQTNDAYSSILESAQQAGFAETDPTDDVAGFDVRSKLTLLISNAFQINISPDMIPCFGIQHINPPTIELLKSKGLKVKLIGEAAIDNGDLRALVIPIITNKEDSFYHIEGEQNVVEVENELSQHQLFQGKGAGRFPTTQAVLADLQLTNSKRSNRPSSSNCEKMEDQERYYFYINSKLLALPTAVRLMNKGDEYSIIKSSFEELECLQNSLEGAFIAKMSEKLYNQYFT